MSKKFFISTVLLVALAFLIPIEHKYDKLFRFYSLTLIPEGVFVSPQYEKKLYFFISDLISLTLLGIGLFWIKIPKADFFKNGLWALFICALCSIAASPFLSYPIAYSRLLQLATPMILFSFVKNAFSFEERERFTNAILIAIVAAGLFQTGVAILQYFHQQPLGLRLLGETNQKTIYLMQDQSRWLIDQVLGIRKGEPEIMRASGTLPHSNVLGGFLFFSLIATYALSMRPKTLHRIWGLTIPFQLFALGLSFSRAALLAWGLATLIWFTLMISRRGFKDSRLIWIGSIVSVSFLATVVLLGNQYLSRGGIVNQTPLSQSSDSIRKTQVSAAFRIISQNPLLGVGFSQFSERSQAYLATDTDRYTKATAPHNIFLFLACETGLIALGAFLIFLGTLFYEAFKEALSIDGATFLSILIGFLAIGFFDFYPILFQQGKLMFFLTAAMLSLHTAHKRQIALYRP